ncbi:MAG: pyridoxamine 5'-phosphate oxidase family protein [Saprospiraceae bacterium]
MEIDIFENWKKIRTHFRISFSSSLHVSIASVNAENQPTVTPIGSLFLNKNQTGFYFEKFTTQLPRNSKENKNVCVLAVNSSKRFWVRSLFKGKFLNDPAIKLYGQLGEKRKATDAEINALKRRMRFTSRLKGHHMLWNNMNYIREINFIKAEKMNIGKMTQ